MDAPVTAPARVMIWDRSVATPVPANQSIVVRPVRTVLTAPGASVSVTSDEPPSGSSPKTFSSSAGLLAGLEKVIAWQAIVVVTQPTTSKSRLEVGVSTVPANRSRW